MRCISWVSDENVWMQSRVGESVSWEYDEWKVSKFENICFELRKKAKVNEKFEFSHLEKFSHLKKLGWNGKTWNSKLNPLSSQKLK